MRVLTRAAAACLLVGGAIGLAACGSSSSGGGGGGGNTIDIYSSLPLQGASSAQTGPLVNGIQLALSQAGGKAGNFTVHYTSLDDSTAAAGKWDPGQTAANARKVAADPKAVFYIGEFNS
jgi:branched-chain amino acid transport system substrate-binding protein